MPLNEDKYVYPRVKITQHVLNHSSVGPAVEDTTVLFAPIYAAKGPTGLCKTNIHSLSEFIEVYGNLDYAKNGQMALMVYNWLHNGGTVCVYKLDCGETAVENTAYKVKAKYVGAYYEDISVEVKKVADTFVKIIVKAGAKRVEEFSKITSKNLLSVIKNSEYIALSDDGTTLIGKIFDNTGRVTMTKETITFSLVDKTITTTETTDVIDYSKVIVALKKFYEVEVSEEETTDENEGNTVEPVGGETSEDTTDEQTDDSDTTEEEADEPDTIYDVLNNRLTPNVDIILDAGYDEELKKGIRKFLAERDDIIGIFDLCVFGESLGYDEPTTIPDFRTVESGLEIVTRTNVAVYDQYFTVYDSIFTDSEIFVSPTYFLSRLIPFNDINYGIQYPTAGTRRGVLTDALSVNENPSSDDKNALFLARVNYVEKSPREYAFMSQRTFDGSSAEEYTALSFLNNARTLERIKKEITLLGREYLFEFNDSTTLAQMQNVLNRYINNWISNRTLATGTVSVRRNEYSDEAVDVTISVRFNGTIEIISVDLTIE